MIPKEKAIELFNRMCNSVDELLPLDVKQCSLIAVDEIIEVINKYSIHSDCPEDAGFEYWREVKQEIEKL
jgi:hypothetical protein